MKFTDKSSFIWSHRQSDKKNEFACFRMEYTVWKEVYSIQMLITASNRYKLYEDGQLIGMGPCPASNKHYYYDVYNLTQPPIGKVTCLSMIAYCIGEATQMVTGQNKGQAGLRYELVVTHLDGSVERIGSDDTTQVISRIPYVKDIFSLDESRISMWSGYREIFDATEELPDWQLPGVDTANVTNAFCKTEEEMGIYELYPREIPYLTYEYCTPIGCIQTEPYLGKIEGEEGLLHEPVSSVTIDASVAGSYPAIVYDFGREVAGYVELELEGSKHANVSIWYGESLDLYRYDTVILPEGKFTYRPYHYRAFRYMKIVVNNSPTPCKLHRLGLYEYRFPYKRVGYFHSSDAVLNEIFEVSRHTIEVNSGEHFMDCPLREQVQWLGDARVMAKASYWLYDSFELVRKSIRQFFVIQQESGCIAAAGPKETELKNLDYPCQLITMIEEYLFYTEDSQFVHSMLPAINRLMDYLDGLEDEEGLLRDRDHKELFLDWAYIERGEQVTILQCLWYQALCSYVTIAKELKVELSRVEIYEQKALAIKSTIRKLLYDASVGLYVDCRTKGICSTHYSQQSSVYALISGIVEPEEVSALLNRIFTLPIEQIRGAYLLSYLVEYLLNNEYEEKAITIMKDYWGEMLRRGATSWWETFDPTTSPSAIPNPFTMNTPTYRCDYIPVSLCHAWGSAPADQLMQHLLGVHPIEKGFKTVHIRPFASDCTFLNGSIPTRYGQIEVKCLVKEGVLEYEISCPEEITVICDQCSDFKITVIKGQK